MMRQFSKFVNFKSHTGLPKSQSLTNAQRIEHLKEQMLEQSQVAPAETTPPSELDTAELSWSQPEEAGRPSSWFVSPYSNHQSEPADEQAISGRISFQGLTAVNETADRLEALLCGQTLKPQPTQPDETGPQCLDDIFWDLKLSNESIHRW